MVIASTSTIAAVKMNAGETGFYCSITNGASGAVWGCFNLTVTAPGTIDTFTFTTGSALTIGDTPDQGSFYSIATLDLNLGDWDIGWNSSLYGTTYTYFAFFPNTSITATATAANYQSGASY